MSGWLLALAVGATLDVPGTHASVADAMAVASPGDVIQIAAGAFADDVDVTVDDLVIRGAGIDDTVLGPGSGNWTVTVDADLSVTFEDLTLDAALADRGVLTVDQGSGDLTLLRVGIVQGRRRGIRFRGRHLEIRGSRFVDNDEDAYTAGGGLYAEGSGTLLVADSFFCGNDAGGWGGGIAIEGHTSARIETTTFVDNTGDWGAALWLGGGTGADVVNSTFVGNAGDVLGSAIYAYQEDLFLLDSVVASQRDAQAVSEGLAQIAPASDHNLYFDNTSGDLGGVAHGANDVFGDPLLADPSLDCSTFDGSLLPGSPAVNAASGTGSLPHIGAWGPIDADGDGVPFTEDCDDSDRYVFPGASETVGDGVDQDCDGQESCYEDADVDGFRTGTVVTSADGDCSDAGEALSSAALDCDDGRDDVNPAGDDATIDGVDQDCSGTETCFVDGDSDGFGTPATVEGTVGCIDAGIADNADDCDDSDVNRFPGAPEQCDDVDNDCDTLVDEDVLVRDWWPDADGDGFGGDDAVPVPDCAAPPDHVSVAGDCDDGEPTVNPGVPEVPCDGVDNDCSAATPDDDGCDSGDTGILATDADTDTDTDADVDADTDADADADADTVDGPMAVEGATARDGCGCRASAHGPFPSWLVRRR